MNDMKWVFILMAVLTSIIQLPAQSGVPQKSPKAYVDYRVGLTEVSVQYSSPAVRGRTIWGGIVPYDKVWRAGANHSTVVSFSTPVVIGGKKLHAGDYAFFLIPKAQGRWTAIFNDDEDQWGAFLYDQSLDAVRMDVRVEELSIPVERLRYHIEDYSLEEGALVMSWEKKQVTIPFYVNAIAPALANYDTLINGMEESERWYFLSEEADMLYDFGRHQDAEAKLDQSLRGGEHVWNLWKKARFLANDGKYDEAYQVVGKIKLLADSGDEEELQTYSNLETEISESLRNWKTRQNRLLEINNDIWIPFSEAYAEGDADKYLSLHSPQFVRASKSGEHTTDLHGYSKNVLRSFSRNSINGAKTTIEFRFTERFASDITASEKGIYKYTYFPPSGSPTSGYGKFHVVSRKENGVWKIFMDYDSDEEGTITAADYDAAYAVHDIRKFD
jgi:tetratricopeptide (TPR) repeat protein